MLWYCSHMFSGMFKKAAVTVCTKQISRGWWVAFMWKKKKKLACPHYQPGTHVPSKKWHQMGPVLFGCGTSSERVFFSKTLISGPQISCQSSAVDRHRIGEKAVPNKSTTCQSHTQTHARSHWHKMVHTCSCAWKHTHTLTHTEGVVDVSYMQQRFLL